MNWYFVGLDLGQSHDYTALAVVERAELTGAFDAAMYAWRKKVELRVRYLERAPLWTPYPDIVERVRQALRRPEVAGRCHLVGGPAPALPPNDEPHRVPDRHGQSGLRRRRTRWFWTGRRRWSWWLGLSRRRVWRRRLGWRRLVGSAVRALCRSVRLQ